MWEVVGRIARRETFDTAQQDLRPRRVVIDGQFTTSHAD
jgi:hypothetical protein